MMDIGEAVRTLKAGGEVRRAGWNGKGMWLGLQEPGDDDGDRGCARGKMTVPFVFMSTAQGDIVPWLCSQTDLLADDWEVVG